MTEQIIRADAGTFIGVPDETIFRWINPKTFTVSVLGLTIDLGELLREVELIHELCEEWLMARWLSHEKPNIDIGEPVH